MKLLRKYQLDIIFLFFAFTVIISTFFYYVKYFSADPHTYEWYIAGPIIVLYFVWMLKIRSGIKLFERRQSTGKSLAYWIALGIIIFASYEMPLSVNEYWSLNVFFLVFTLLLADSFWDFRKLTIKEVVK